MMIRLALIGLAGLPLACQRVDRAEPTIGASAAPVNKDKSILPRPDPFRITYNPETRTLTLYDLADSGGHWMMISPRNVKGEPLGLEHVFMDDIELDDVAVFYLAAGNSSARVSLREIVTVQVSQRP